MSRRVRFIIGFVFLVFVLSCVSLVGSVALWAQFGPSAAEQALSDMRDFGDVMVTTTRRGTVFQPRDGTPDTGLVLYPAGRVDYRSYAPVARSIANEGYLVAVVNAPLNLAFLNTEAAARFLDDHPDVDTWAVGGHSIGAVVASVYAVQNSVDALVLWAGFPNSDFTESDLPVLMIYGTEDGLLSQEAIDEALGQLSASAEIVVIDGGNHEYFGSYTSQVADDEAQITREAQQTQVIDTTVAFLDGLNP